LEEVETGFRFDGDDVRIDDGGVRRGDLVSLVDGVRWGVDVHVRCFLEDFRVGGGRIFESQDGFFDSSVYD
jgi:hypothetical protein